MSQVIIYNGDIRDFIDEIIVPKAGTRGKNLDTFYNVVTNMPADKAAEFSYPDGLFIVRKFLKSFYIEHYWGPTWDGGDGKEHRKYDRYWKVKR
jgi:hypothetical protein